MEKILSEFKDVSFLIKAEKEIGLLLIHHLITTKYWWEEIIADKS